MKTTALVLPMLNVCISSTFFTTFQYCILPQVVVFVLEIRMCVSVVKFDYSNPRLEKDPAGRIVHKILVADLPNQAAMFNVKINDVYTVTATWPPESCGIWMIEIDTYNRMHNPVGVRGNC